MGVDGVGWERAKCLFDEEVATTEGAKSKFKLLVACPKYIGST
jgi:hypothetical protein